MPKYYVKHSAVKALTPREFIIAMTNEQRQHNNTLLKQEANRLDSSEIFVDDAENRLKLQRSPSLSIDQRNKLSGLVVSLNRQAERVDKYIQNLKQHIIKIDDWQKTLTADDDLFYTQGGQLKKTAKSLMMDYADLSSRVYELIKHINKDLLKVRNVKPFEAPTRKPSLFGLFGG